MQQEPWHWALQQSLVEEQLCPNIAQHVPLTQSPEQQLLDVALYSHESPLLPQV